MLTVNTTIPDNVNTAYNFYQENSNKSNSESSNSFGSQRYPHSSEGKANVRNIKITGDEVSHSNIQTTARQNIQNRINQRIDEYDK